MSNVCDACRHGRCEDCRTLSLYCRCCNGFEVTQKDIADLGEDDA